MGNNIFFLMGNNMQVPDIRRKTSLNNASDSACDYVRICVI